jgi:hypothetical protein
MVDLSLAQPSGLDLKVIALSVHDECTVRSAAMVAGADAFVGVADDSRSPGRRRIMSVVTRTRSVDAVHTHPEWNVEWMKEENAVETSSRRASSCSTPLPRPWSIRRVRACSVR